MKKRASHLLCGLLLLTLSTATLAGDSLTARIPASIAAGNYAEAEMLIAEAVKIGVITTTAAAALRIRGREQQLIDFHGGAQSDTRKIGEPDRTENAVRAVARDHHLGRQFHEAATAKWGMLARYTGD